METRLISRTILALTAVVLAALLSGGSVAAAPPEHPAAGGAGRHAVVPDSIFASFQMNHRAVQCRIAHGVQGGTAIQMFMDSTSVDGYEVDGNTVTATGAMVSTTIFGQGRDRVTISETVPYEAVGTDEGSPGANADSFFLTVSYDDVEGGQGPIFASAGFGTCDGDTCLITFGGTLVSGNVSVG